MNLSPEWIEVFTVAEIESVHWSRIGDPAAEDTVLMKYAQLNNYVVFTNDLASRVGSAHHKNFS